MVDKNFYQKVEEFERGLVTNAVQTHATVKSAAMALGIRRTTLTEIMRRLNIRHPIPVQKRLGKGGRPRKTVCSKDGL